VPPGEANFNGPAILIVEAAKVPEDPDDYEDGDSFLPSNRFHGIVATAWSGGSANDFGGDKGAIGVVGRGGRNEGTGVAGLGGGTPEPGNGGEGGIGVYGRGGPKQTHFSNPATPPGAGVVAQGGRQSDTGNTLRRPHAAGLIAIGGGTGVNHDFLPAHPLTETGGVGVYGQGAEQMVVDVPVLNETGASTGSMAPSGPLEPGAGVLGRGGVPIPPEGPVAAGVIGLAGGVPVRGIAETGDAGVFGRGPAAGVRGQSADGGGVHGVADNDGRGGVFQSRRAAQVRLVPQKASEAFLNPASVAPVEIPAGREGIQLSKDGQGGDLLAQMDGRKQCALWFCVRGSDGTSPVQWAQVLLGTAFDGRV
jgi:hypothetical protein